MNNNFDLNDYLRNNPLLNENKFDLRKRVRNEILSILSEEKKEDEKDQPEEAQPEEEISTSELSPDIKEMQNLLDQAHKLAEKMNDKKLIDQIGNTITFFTRSHIVSTGKGI
jgi:uncharacterized Zn finger protein